MVRLVDDLLDVSRVSRGKIELRTARVELGLIVNSAVEAARSLVDCMGHDLTVALPLEPIFLIGDSARLAQVIGNLLSNACKFTGKGGRLSLEIEKEDSVAVIRMRDSGIGISREQLPKLFELFMQVDSSLERPESGLGIGLTLVKHLVEMHSGTVEAFSAGLGLGSDFVVRLPLAPGLVESVAGLPATELAPTGNRILVVDDNVDAAESLAMVLGLTGHVTAMAYDGEAAIQVATAFAPEVIILDIGLPKLNGYEVARRIRQTPWGRRVVLIALTGWGQDRDRQIAADAGFDGYTVKPVDADALLQLVAQCLRNRPRVA